MLATLGRVRITWPSKIQPCPVADGLKVDGLASWGVAVHDAETGKLFPNVVSVLTRAGDTTGRSSDLDRPILACLLQFVGENGEPTDKPVIATELNRPAEDDPVAGVMQGCLVREFWYIVAEMRTA